MAGSTKVPVTGRIAKLAAASRSWSPSLLLAPRARSAESGTILELVTGTTQGLRLHASSVCASARAGDLQQRLRKISIERISDAADMGIEAAR